MACGEIPPDARKTSFALCTGCRIFSFCTAECHQQAWSSDILPHRGFCRTLGKLTDVWGTTMKDNHEKVYGPGPRAVS